MWLGSRLTILVVAGPFVDASASTSKPFLMSVLLMVVSTLVFFMGTTPLTIVLSRAIQGTSTTFTWVTGLAYLAAQVDEDKLGQYVGWTTVGVAVGEIVGPMVGGPVYEYLGHWATFGVVQALLFVDIGLRVFAREKSAEAPGVRAEQTDPEDSETSRLLPEQTNRIRSRDLDGDGARALHKAMRRLARDWLGSVFVLIVIFMVRGALEVVS